MTEWIRCANGMLLNKRNILTLKVHKTNCAVQAECLGNRTIDLAHCGSREEAMAKCDEIAGVTPAKKPAAKKAQAKK